MNLLLFARDGTETRIDSPREAQVQEASQALDPALHAALRLETEAAHVEVLPLRYAANSCGSAAVRVVRGDEIRWVGRVRAGDHLVLHGSRLPRLIEVPTTWATNALESLLRGECFNSCLPWYDERFEPLGAWRADAFGFQVLSAAGPRVKPLLVELRDQVLHALRSTSLPEDVFDTLIAELRRVGHDLWNVEAKSNGECWSSDYMRWAEGRGLYLDFNWGPPIRLVIELDDATSA
jgi:hypothetical protein